MVHALDDVHAKSTPPRALSAVDVARVVQLAHRAISRLHNRSAWRCSVRREGGCALDHARLITHRTAQSWQWWDQFHCVHHAFSAAPRVHLLYWLRSSGVSRRGARRCQKATLHAWMLRPSSPDSAKLDVVQCSAVQLTVMSLDRRPAITNAKHSRTPGS
jgi:hypothetical protein